MESHQMRAELLRVLGAGATLKVAGRCYQISFDNQYQLVGEGVEERVPVAMMRSCDVQGARLKKETVVEVFNPLDAVTKDYRVKRLEPDGTGMTLVVLRVS